MPNSAIKKGDLVEVSEDKDVFLVDEIDPRYSVMYLVPIVTNNCWSLDRRGRAPFGYPPAGGITKLEYPNAE